MFALARANHNRANLLNVTPRFRECDAMYREAIRLHDQIPRPSQEHREALASVLGDWARYLHHIEDFEAAEAPRDRAIALRKQLVEDHPSVPSYRLKMAILHQNLGYVLAMKRRFEESKNIAAPSFGSPRRTGARLSSCATIPGGLGQHLEFVRVPLVADDDQGEEAQAAWETARRLYLELLEEQPDDRDAVTATWQLSWTIWPVSISGKENTTSVLPRPGKPSSTRSRPGRTICRTPGTSIN